MSNYRRSVVPGGIYFFTVALADRKSQLLTLNVEELRSAYRRVQRDYPFETIAICVLPDHIHALWKLPPDDAAYSLRWRLIKGHFSRCFQVVDKRSTSKINKREKGIWQRRFWEHQIRDDNDLQRHVDYIHMNPVRHGYVSSPADWRYSSIHDYIQRGIIAEDWAVESSEQPGKSLVTGDD